MKKTLSIILSLCMLLSITAGMNLTAFAEDTLPTSGKCGDNATFTYDKNTGTLVISGKGAVTGVERIEDGVLYYDYAQFSEYDDIKSVVINEGITALMPSNSPFSSCFCCKNLESVSLPDSLLAISGQESSFSFKYSKYADDSSHWKDNIFYVDTFLIDGQKASGDVAVKSGIKGIGNFAFFNNEKITSVSLPEGLKSIGFYSIRECENLKSVSLPSTLEHSEEWSLAWNPKLTDVDFSKTRLTEIPAGMLWACENLKTIRVPASVKSFGDNAVGSTCLSDIYYGGTMAEWAKVKISTENYGYDTNALSTYIKNKNVNIHCSDGVIKAEKSSSDDNSEAEENSDFEVELSKTSYVYSGKTKKPSVTVTYKDGTELKENEDYTVTYDKGRKYVGKYGVTVEFIGDYSGSESITAYFTIKPKGTTLKKLYRLKKGFKANWKKQRTQTSGYQLQYSRYKSFKKSKKVTVKGNKKTLRAVKKLSKKKYYYVRIRTYKTVNGEKIYSSWSKAKKVKTR